MLATPGVLAQAGKWTFNFLKEILTEAGAARRWGKWIWEVTKREAKHYWHGTKLLGAELRTSSRLLSRKLAGEELTRRERMQLARSWADIGRLGPFMVFVIVPFMEFTLPFFLKMFPNMLPSTFIDEKQVRANRSSVSQRRLHLASFLQEMVAEMEAKVRARNSPDADKTVEALVDFVDKSRMNEPLSKDTLATLTKVFSDELTLERMSREQLTMMCKYMGVRAFGSEAFLRYSLLARLKAIRADDESIAAEGVDSFSLEELKQAALERGMRAESDDPTYYRAQLARWVELSIEKDVPAALLVLSRAFAVTGPEPAPASSADLRVAETVLSKLEPQVVTDALLDAVDASSSSAAAAGGGGGGSGAAAAAQHAKLITKAKLVALEAENASLEAEAERKREAAKPRALGVGSDVTMKGTPVGDVRDVVAGKKKAE